MTKSYRFVVTGRVQGVHFRQSTRRQALRLDLRGWVRNRDDGAVEGCAAGEHDALRTLNAWLWRGPEAAQVVSVEWTEADAFPEIGFEVQR